MRLKFPKDKQRKFMDLVIEKTNSPSLRGLLQFGLDLNYSTLKNYYSESRLIPQNLFEDLCNIAKLDKNNFHFELLDDHWGQAKGGRKSKRS